jgi:hypothetical protein
MADVTVPSAPALSRIANVELVHTGSWNASTGPVTFTITDLANAVAALDCPAITRPKLKLGHTDPRFDGEPAVGFIENMAVADNGRTLVGDYSGMPGWLGPVIASAYPDRSIEGVYDFRCALSHTHPFVITGVALLGIESPAVGTLESLQDVALLYGVDVAAAASDTRVHGQAETPVVITTTEGGAMPNPAPAKVAATVTSEDIRRAYYDVNTSWDLYIEEIQLDPLQLIVCDDSTGDHLRVPITIGAGEGTNAVAFGEPTKVIIRYEDAAKVAASGGRAPIRYASKAESRGVTASQELPAEPVEGTNPTQPEVIVADASSTLREGLLSRLGVTDADVDDDTLLAALGEALAERADPPPPNDQPLPVAAAVRAAPTGAVVIDSMTLELIQAQARRGDEAFARMAADDRDRTIAAAVTDGKIPRSRVDHWRTSWGNDPDGTKQALAGMQKDLVPREAVGHPGDADAFSEEYASLFPKEA